MVMNVSKVLVEYLKGSILELSSQEVSMFQVPTARPQSLANYDNYFESPQNKKL